jgi:pSer/pThr/pTyr-binding forkhead associated (FHA) protein
VIICPKCTKENQDHYKFCLGCGAELPRDASPKKFAPTSNTPPQGVPKVQPPHAIADESTTQGVTGDGASAGGDAPPVICPQCSHPNPVSNKFCASCGFKLGKPASVPAPDAAAAAPAPTAAAAAAAAAPIADAPIPGGISLTALRADGTEAGIFHMPATQTTIGRDSGSIFAGDSYLSPRHATFVPKGKLASIRDESSLNGIYKKIGRDEPVELGFGDIFRIGQEILRIEQLVAAPKSADGVERLGSPARGYVARLALLIGRDTTGNAYPIPESGLHLGRERGDVLFPEDGYVSGLHCRVSWANGRIYVTDLGSSNGSFIRLMRDATVTTGDILLMGQQLFRVAINA